MAVTTIITVCWSSTMHALWKLFLRHHTAQILINFVTDFCLSVSDMFYKGIVSAQGKAAVRKMNVKV